jgi:hypothetical protein
MLLYRLQIHNILPMDTLMSQLSPVNTLTYSYLRLRFPFILRPQNCVLRGFISACISSLLAVDVILTTEDKKSCPTSAAI